MCLDRSGKHLKGKGGAVIAYKVVRKHQVKGGNYAYGPICISTNMRWTPDKWYRAKYDSCSTFRSAKTGREVYNTRGIYGKAINLLKATGKLIGLVIPMVGNGLVEYPCGFHYIESKEDCLDYIKSGYKAEGDKFVLCEFKEVVVKNGFQWGVNCGVARKMRIIREVPVMEIRS